MFRRHMKSQPSTERAPTSSLVGARPREASQQMLLAAVDAVRDYAIFALDQHGLVATWNEGAERLKGWSADEIIGAHFSRFYPAQDVASGKCEWELEEARQCGRLEDEGWRIRKDGTRFWADVVITTIRDARGDVVGYSKVTRDLTERKHAEDKLRRAHDELERRVEERTRELAEANAKLLAREQMLEEALRGRDEFLAIAAHELRTPLTTVRLQVERLRGTARPGPGGRVDPGAVAKSAESAARAVGSLVQLVELLLDVSRARTGQLTLRRSPVDLAEVVRESVASADGALQAAGCEVRVDAAASIVAEVDRARVAQLVDNLLSNAAKYAAGKPVHVTLARDDHSATIEVRDEGPGIDLAQQAVVFQRFARATPPNGVSGLGLGLWLARRIAETHGGRLTLESAPGRGATFRATLPLSPAS